MGKELRPFWSRIFKFDWTFGVFLIILICIPRFYLVLEANVNKNYGSIGAIMFISAILPFVFLSKLGRRELGLVKTKKYLSLFIAFGCGIFIALALHYLGYLLYGSSSENWYSYIGQSYNISPTISAYDKRILFLVMAITGMTYSPLGEEFFFRGLLYSSFKKSSNIFFAAVVSSLAFALVHISHFGLIYVEEVWSFLIIPTLLWTLAMFLLSLVCVYFRRSTASIWGAVSCHSGFNLGMIYSIFYLF